MNLILMNGQPLSFRRVQEKNSKGGRNDRYFTRKFDELEKRIIKVFSSISDNFYITSTLVGDSKI